MANLAYIADRVLDCPLLITPEKMAVIEGVLDGRIGLSEPLGIKADGFVGSRVREDDEGNLKLLPYKVEDSVAIIRMIGTLVNRGSYVGPSSGLISYEGFKHQLKVAVEDPEVQSILLDFDSCGGEAMGTAECAEIVSQVNAIKPITSLVNGTCCSAAYWIASATSEIVITPSGAIGSIGVLYIHTSAARKIEEAGLDVTIIHAGARKKDGNPYEALSNETKARVQKKINDMYGAFTGAVGRYRGDRFTEEQARASEAEVLSAEEAVAVGMADRIGTFESVFEELSSASRARLASSQIGDQQMGEPQTEQLDRDTLKAEGADQAKSRIKAITNAGNKAEMPGLASYLAFDTDIGQDQCAAIITAAKADLPEPKEPREKQEASTDYFEQKEADGAIGLAAPEAPKNPEQDAKAFWNEEFNGGQ